MSEWKQCRLGDVADYVVDKIDIQSLDTKHYVSTDNMLPNKGGIEHASKLPDGAKTPCFHVKDILVSNIRPYFKKIWKATHLGGASPDVLIFRGDPQKITQDYLYYILSDDSFFNYSVATSKGTKMPRGDKKAIMDYTIPLPSLPTQRKITSILSALDDKIELNNRMNKNLEEQAQAIFSKLFAYKVNGSENLTPLNDLITVVDNRGKTPPLENKPTPYPIIDVKSLSGQERTINYNNCTKFVNKHTYDNWFRCGHPRNLDILLSTVGSVAELKMFIGDIGCIAQNVVGLRCKRVSPYYLYQYLIHIRKELLTYDIGSVQPSIKVTHIIKHLIYVPTEDEMNLFNGLLRPITHQIYNNSIESRHLSALRDTLLPKLMSGELNVSEVLV